MTSGVSCTICSECYKADDDVYVTRCGHVFHYQCLMRWKGRSSNCAVCSSHNPETFKVFLNIEEREVAALPPRQRRNGAVHYSDEDSDDDVLDDTVLDQSNIQLQLDNNMRVQNALKMELNKSIDEISALQAKLQEHQDLQLKLAQKFSENETHVEVVHGYVHTLVQQRDSSENELNRKSEELQRLEQQLQQICENGGNAEQMDVLMTTKLSIMEKKLKAVSDQLDNEVATTTKLTLENTKLQHLLSAKGSSMQPIDVGDVNGNVSSSSSTVEMPRQQPAPNNTENPTEMIIIKGLPKELEKKFWYPTVTSLAGDLGIKLPRYAVKHVNQLGGDMASNDQNDGTLALVVKFNESGYKDKFLSCNEKLASLEKYKDCSFEELKYTRNASIFEYAKILRKCGYKAVYINKGKVVAKKNDGDPLIIIRNKQHVDALKLGGN